MGKLTLEAGMTEKMNPQKKAPQSQYKKMGKML